jgi:formylglycine-generating enzyme required for sulfatase activity
MEIVYVPVGEFTMGSTKGQADAAWRECGSNCDKKLYDTETPQHTVYLDAYWIDKTEVTNAMYRKCVDENGCTKPDDTSHYDNNSRADHPVVYVDWNQAQAYCNWVGGRLPTEAEWEKAARGTDRRVYPWGNDPPNADLLNYKQNISDTTAVGSYPSGASPYGIMDMAGNVWEWVNDWYDEKYYQNSPKRNPQGATGGQYRVLHGGSAYTESRYVRAAFRHKSEPALRYISIGFRCVRFP